MREDRDSGRGAQGGSDGGRKALARDRRVLELAEESLHSVPRPPVSKRGRSSLPTRLRGRRTSLLVPDALAEKGEVAVANRRKLPGGEAGRRYGKALQVQRKKKGTQTFDPPFLLGGRSALRNGPRRSA